MAAQKPRNFSSDEVQFVSTGSFSEKLRQDPVAASLLQRYESAEYRKAEALARTQDDLLQLLKSLLARGLLDEAGEVLQAIKNQIRDCEDLASEIRLQESRYEYLRGRWLEAVRSCNEVEARSDVTALQRFVLHQVRSNAFFELRDFGKSFVDYRKVESFQALFPFGQIPLYAHANRVRLELRTVGSETAEKNERLLWSSWANTLPSSNLDPLLTLLRMVIDRKRFLGLPHREVAETSYAVAHALGDESYEALACLDVFVSGFSRLSGGEWEKTLDSHCSRHPRVRELRRQAFDPRIEACETARNMRDFMDREEGLPSRISNQGASEVLLIPEFSIKADLRDKKIVRAPMDGQIGAILRALSEGPVEKAEFFRRVWGLSRFSMEMHDSVIRTALKRVRQRTGIEVSSQRRVLSLPEKVRVLFF